MERRVLLAIFLSFIVLFTFQQFVEPPPTPGGPDATNTPGASPAPGAGGASAAPGSLSAPGAPSLGTNASGAPTASGAPVAPIRPAAPIVGDAEEREIVVETMRVRAVFVNRGARIRHWYLKDYRNSAGEPIDLVPERTTAEMPLPFSLRTEGQVTTTVLNESLYRLAGSPTLPIDATKESATLVFELETADGLKARKTFTLDYYNYVITFSAQVEQNGQQINPTIDMGPGLGDDIARTEPGSFLSPSYMYLAQAIYEPMDEGDAEREAAASLGTGAVRQGSYRWAGVDDHYFISAVLQPAGEARLEYIPVNIPTMGTPPQVGHYVAWALKLPSSPEGVRFYYGPKQLDTLRAIDPAFVRAIYFGIFAFLAAPLLDALKWVYGFVGNWGWSIVVLTILINLVMAPLRHKSVVSMRKMQELQPQIKALQERYAKYKITDPERQKMNTEMMELYRSKGVNPASGCVPMLLTLPFLFAFYAMLGQAIEIRGAEWFWIPDLAAADPLYIVPLLMGATMFWQQKITPTTADPTQQRIMMMMPVLISVTMLFAPSGLVLYWLVSNVWAIGQQYFTNSLLGPPKISGAGGSKVAKEVKAPKRPKGALAPATGKQ